MQLRSPARSVTQTVAFDKASCPEASDVSRWASLLSAQRQHDETIFVQRWLVKAIADPDAEFSALASFA